MPDDLLENKLDQCSALYDNDSTGTALKCYEAILSFKPDSGIAYYLKGMCLYRLDKLREAIACFDISVGLDKDQCLPHHAKGCCLMRLGEYDLAIRSLKTALELNPKDVETMFLLASCFLLINDEQQAREWISLALKMDGLKTKGMLQSFFENFILGSESLRNEEIAALHKQLEKLESRKHV